jgi:uncharacterized protein YdaU (DUF1376 family)
MPRRYHKKAIGTAELFAKLLPMPVAPILLCGPLLTVEGPVYRAVLCLAFAYWCAGCKLPDDDASRSQICRLPPQRWKPIRADVDAALSALLPALKAEFDARQKTAARLRAAALYANQCRHNKNRTTGTRAANDLTAAVERPRIQPHKAPRHSNGRVDLAARSAATERERNAKATAATGKLSDTVPSRLATRSPG